MKAMLAILILITVLLLSDSNAEQQKIGPLSKPLSSPGPINFRSQLEPVFRKNCSPCHFPGGKMYERMPFDHATTILSHEAGIMRRIRNEKETALIRQFILENKGGK